MQDVSVEHDQQPPNTPRGSGESERLRVLHLTAGSDAGGVSRYLFDLGSIMTERGHAVAVAGERGAWHDLFEGAPFEWKAAPLKGGPGKLWRATRELERWCEAWKPDVLHVHYRRSALVARRLGRRLGVPVLFTLHLTGVPLRGPWRWLSDFGDHTHVASAEAERWLVEEAGVLRERISLIPHGIDPSRFPLATDADRIAARQHLGLPTHATIAAFVGRFDQPKNEDWVLDLAQQTRENLPNLVVLMVGGGPHEPAVRRRVEREGLTGRVRVIAYTDPLPVYRACDLLLLPSSREGFSLVCAEAASVGRAVLRTCTAGAEETVVEGVTGQVVPIDPCLFLNAASQMLQQPMMLQAMGQAGAAHVRNHLTLDRQAERTLMLYHRMRSGKP